MIITLICILFSNSLNFDGLTLSGLFQWYQHHPFLFLFALGEVFQYTVNVSRK